MTKAQPIKIALVRFLERLEQAQVRAQNGEATSVATEPPPSIIAQAEAELELALTGDQPLLLSCGDAAPEAVVAALVLRRAKLQADQVLAGHLKDEDFEALTTVVKEIKTSRLMVELPAEQPVSGPDQ